LTAGDSTNTTFAGSISGGGSLTKTGSGSLTLSGANTYTGATQVLAGSLIAQNDSALGVNSAVTVATGATLTAASAPLGSGLRGQYYNIAPASVNNSDPDYVSLAALETSLQGQTPNLEANSTVAGANFDFGNTGSGFPAPYNANAS